jgi:hypothetical protein
VVLVVGINVHSTSFLSTEEEWSTHYKIKKSVTGTPSKPRLTHQLM